MRTLSNFLRLAAPYWMSAQRWYAWVMLVVVVGCAMGIIEVGVYLNRWNKRFYDALAQYDGSHMPDLVLEWLLYITITVLLVIVGSWTQKRLMFDWREHLTRWLEDRWLTNHAQYRLKLREEPDNPDQRIAEDAYQLADRTIVLVKYFIMNLFKLVAFTSILWGLSGVVRFTIFGTEIEIHGFMVWVALVWSVVCTIITHYIGRRLKPLNVERQHREADFRATLLRVRDNAEQVASWRGEDTEMTRFNGRFQRIKENWLALIRREFQLEAFTSSYLRLNRIIGILAALPVYLTRSLTFGDLIQASTAFSNVQDGFGWLLDYYKRIMEWAAVVERLHRFDESLTHAQAVKSIGTPAEDNEVRTHALSIFTPFGKLLSSGINLAVKPGSWMLVDGRSGAGKSTLLRTLAGLWPFAKGSFSLPDKKFLFVTQKAYLPFDALEDVLTYPVRGRFTESELKDALEKVGLGRLSARLKEKKDWAQELSGGESQRLAFARVLLNRPEILFLDEATNQLDDASAMQLISILKTELPQTVVLMVPHQPAVKNLAETRIEIGGPAPAVA